MNTYNKLTTLIMFMLGCATTWALPSVAPSNLQTTTGVTTSVAGNTLTVTAPNQAILNWQNFGSGTDTIAVGDTVSYALPTASASVLNIVGGANKTAIDGSITSNGNVYILNPNGVIIGAGSRVDVNSLYISTNDSPFLAGFYFQTNGRLPSQERALTASGSITVAGGTMSAPGGVHLNTKTAEIGGLVVQGDLIVTADGVTSLGVGGTTFVTGNASVNNVSGTTNIGAVGSTLIVNNNITVNSTTGLVQSNAGANVSAKKLTVSTTGDVALAKVDTTDAAITGNNIVFGYANGLNSTFTGLGTSSATVTAPGALTVNYTGTGTGDVIVVANGALTLGKIANNSTGNTNFTGSSVTDSVGNAFVYGPAGFTATSGNISITKANNSFGPVSLTTAGEATFTEAATTNFNRVNVGKLVATSGGGFIEVLPGAAINTPVAVLSTPGNVTLANSANTIGNLTVTGGNVTVANTGALTLGNVTAAGSLAVSTSTFVTQAADTRITVTGNVAITGTTATLSNAGNQFGPLTVDVGNGTAAITEDSTLNLVSLKAGTAALKSLEAVITSGTGSVVADTFNVVAGTDFVPTAVLKTTNALTVVAGKSVDLSLLNLVTNLNNKAPTVVTAVYKAPQP